MEDNLSNIFNGTIHRYHQWRYEYTDAIVDQNLDRAAIVILLRALGFAQHLSKTSFTLTTAKILDETGLHRHSWSAARKQLNDSGIMKIEQAPGKGAWKFTLPVTYRYLDLDTCTSDEIRAYYERYLTDAVDDGDRLVSTCPFHDKKKQFTVKLKEDIDSRIGTWSCFCGTQHSGRILAFEQRISGVDERQAHRNVTDFFMKLRREQKEQSEYVDATLVPNPQYRTRQPYRPKTEEAAAL